MNTETEGPLTLPLEHDASGKKRNYNRALGSIWGNFGDKVISPGTLTGF
jgi:hypothetical protein